MDGSAHRAGSSVRSVCLSASVCVVLSAVSISTPAAARAFSTTRANAFKVAVIGAGGTSHGHRRRRTDRDGRTSAWAEAPAEPDSSAFFPSFLFLCSFVFRVGGIGQPLSLLLKQHPLITQLSLYDISPVIHGVTADLSHCDTPAKVEGHQESLAAALKDADVVVMPAGVPRKPVSWHEQQWAKGGGRARRGESGAPLGRIRCSLSSDVHVVRSTFFFVLFDCFYDIL